MNTDFDIKNIQEKILNKVIVSFALFSFALHLVFIIYFIVQAQFNITAAIKGSVALPLYLLAIFRNKLSFKAKIIILISSQLVGFFIGVYHEGLLATAIIFMVVSPVFISFITSQRNALLFLFLSLSILLFFSFLYINGYLTEIRALFASKQIFLWVQHLTVIFFTSWGLLYVSVYYRKSLIKSHSQILKQKTELDKHRNKLEHLVKEKTDELSMALEELQATNEELHTINEEMYNKNEVINSKNEALTQALNNLQRTQQKLIQAEKMASLGTLTAGVSHEINNPLNFIVGSYEGLKNYFEEHGSSDSKTTTLLLDALKLGTDRATNIVKGLNQFSRNIEKTDEICNVHAILDNCLIMLNNEVKNKIEIIKNYYPGEINISCNVGKLHQVFINLLTNAIYAIKEEGVITIETKIIDESVIITISDNGTGIEKEHLSQITDPFFTTKPPGEGTGLGLSIAYSILKEHKGTIDFKSEKNIGTKATITLPVNPQIKN